MTATITLPKRKVCRISAPGAKNLWQVFVEEINGLWEAESKQYPHSTSAFAALGRLYQKDIERAEA